MNMSLYFDRERYFKQNDGGLSLKCKLSCYMLLKLNAVTKVVLLFSLIKAKNEVGI